MVPFSNILFIERTPTHSMHGVTCAAVLARSQGAALTVAGYVGSGPPSLSAGALTEDESRMCRWWARRVEELSDVADLNGVPSTRAELLGGDFQVAVNQQVRRGGHDLVVVIREASRRSWPLRPHWTDRRLLRETEASVLFLSPRQAAEFTRVLAAIDVSSDDGKQFNQAVAHRAVTLGRRLRGEVELVHAWALIGESILASPRRGVSPARLAELRENEGRRRLERLQELVDASSDVPVRLSIPHGAAGRTIEQKAIAWGADLIVVGRPKASAVESLFLGTLSEYLLGRIPAAVLVVHPSDAASVDRAAETEARELENAS